MCLSGGASEPLHQAFIPAPAACERGIRTRQDHGYVIASARLQRGLDALGLLAALETLQLTFNPALRGALPESLGNLSRLRRLYAWNTSLGGALPRSIGRLAGSLVAIDLTDNQLAGALPDSLAQLRRVDTAYFDGNPRLECPLSPQVAAWLKGVKYHADPCRSSNGARQQFLIR